MASPASGSRDGTAGPLLVGVGVGPGDPGLITCQALDILRTAERVVAPTSGSDVCGRAESIVHQALPDLPVTRVVFEMAAEGAGDGGLSSDARAESHHQAARSIRPWLEAEEQVAFATLGDPNIYSTFSSLVAALRQQGWHGPVATTPGITAFQALAARSGTVLLDGIQSLSLVTALDGTARLEGALRRRDEAIVIYKGGRHLPEVARLLARHARLDGAVLGELLGMPTERVAALATVADHAATYLATIIVPPVARPE